MSGRPVRFGFIGCGVVTVRDILPHLIRDAFADRLRLVAVCDLDKERAQVTAQQFGANWHTDDVAALCRAEDVDAIAIATPVATHYDIARQVLTAGKHVYIQKTMTLTVAEADALLELRDWHHLKLVASPGQHLNPYRRPILGGMRRHLEAGAIGKPAWGVSRYAVRHEDEPFRKPGGEAGSVGIDPSWYYRNPGGGPLPDVTVYGAHELTLLLGPAKRVSARSAIVLPEREWEGRTFPVTAEDNVAMIVEFPGDVLFTMLSNFIRGSSFSPNLELHGTDGEMVSGGKAGPLQVYATDRAAEMGMYGYPTRQIFDGADAFRPPTDMPNAAHIVADMLHWADCIQNGTTPTVSGEHARHVIELFEKARIAAETGRTQELSTTFQPPEWDAGSESL